MRYDWPGNVRQLENLTKRLVVLGTEAPIFKELQQPAQPLSFRLAATGPRAVPPPPIALVSPPPPPPAPTPVPTAAARSVSVSLKDIARTAAREAERELILRMLTRTRWNRKEAAEILGISYKALLYKIKENGLDKAS
jgi:DNA-binding NtrC family response regulator